MFPWAVLPQSEDEKFMLIALEEAYQAFLIGEVPVGAVLVKEGEVIARGHNLVESLKDAIAHAEMRCLSQGFVVLDNWRLANTTLYCTLEPCVMCIGAMFSSRIKRLVWGASSPRLGGNGGWINLLESKHPMHKIEVEQGVLKETSSQLMKEFFRKQRQLKAKKMISE